MIHLRRDFFLKTTRNLPAEFRSCACFMKYKNFMFHLQSLHSTALEKERDFMLREENERNFFRHLSFYCGNGFHFTTSTVSFSSIAHIFVGKIYQNFLTLTEIIFFSFTFAFQEIFVQFEIIFSIIAGYKNIKLLFAIK